MSDSIAWRLRFRVPTDRSSVARVRAAALFAFAAREESGLTDTGKLRCWEAVTALAVTSADLEDRHFRAAGTVGADTTPGSAVVALVEGLSILGRLDLELFADPRVRGAAKHARRALRSIAE
jgi:hypothetical protein